MKKTIFILALFSLFFFAESASAKVLPQAKSGQKTVTKSISSGISVSPKLRKDKRALNVSFSNLQNATSVSYLLTYKTSTQNEGAGGSLNLRSKTATQELLFGTCSKNVCRYHTGINNMKLEISYTSKNGKKYLKKYRIKV